MDERPIGANRNPASKAVSPPAGWETFEQELAAALGLLKDEILVVAAKAGNRFVQFNVQSAFGLRAEAVSNAYLEEAERLDDARVADLLALGWSPPTHAPEDAAPRRRSGGSPNFFRDFPSPVPCAEVARLAVRTLAEVLQVPAPGSLEYKAFDREGHAVLLPALGVARVPPPRPRPAPRPSAAFRALRRSLRSAVRRLAADETIGFDRDGDLPLPVAGRPGFAKALQRPLLVRLFCLLVPDVEGDEALLRRLHDLNARLPLVRLVLSNGAVFAAVDFPADPFHLAHLAIARAFLERVVNDLERDLRAAPAPGPPAESAGGSLPH